MVLSHDASVEGSTDLSRAQWNALWGAHAAHFPGVGVVSSRLEVPGGGHHLHFKRETTEDLQGFGHRVFDASTTYEEFLEHYQGGGVCALYAINGSWGAVLSWEDYKIIGGPREFIRNVKLRYPQWIDDLVQIRDLFAEFRSAPWTSGLLAEL
jgi:hypothetical protein